MRALTRNMTTLYWSQPTGTRAPVYDANGLFTGTYSQSFSTKVPLKAYLTVPDGSVESVGFGRIGAYDYEMIGVGQCPFEDNAKIFKSSTDTEPAYLVAGIFNSLTGFRVALKKVEVRS